MVLILTCLRWHLGAAFTRHTFPGRGAAPSARLRASSTRYGGAPLIRDRSGLGVWDDPRSAAHHFAPLRAAPGKRTAMGHFIYLSTSTAASWRSFFRNAAKSSAEPAAGSRKFWLAKSANFW